MPYIVPNMPEILQIAKNKPTFSFPRPSKINPNWDFWYETKASGNPDDQQEKWISENRESRAIKIGI
jgi:hypothetical protein